jgi:hypothetical protein
MKTKKPIRSDWDKKLDREINKVKKGIRTLETTFGLKLYVDKDVETMIGSIVDHVYIRDVSSSGTICLQKHLFTVRK